MRINACFGQKRTSGSWDDRQRHETPPGAAGLGFHFARTPRGLATMPSVMADDGRHRTQFEAGYRRNDIEPGLTLDAERLKGE